MRVAVVTEGASGMKLAVRRRLARRGAEEAAFITGQVLG